VIYKIYLLLAVLLFAVVQPTYAFDLKKEAQKALEKEKKKFEEQQRKEKEKKEQEKKAAQPAPAPTPTPAPTPAPAPTPPPATTPANNGAAVQPPAQPVNPTPPPATNSQSSTTSGTTASPSPTPPAQDTSKMSTAEKIRYAWQKIPQATNIYSPSGDTVFPKNLEDESGGMISAHLMSIYSLDQLEKMSGNPPYIRTKGPDGKPIRVKFAQVNPKFVDWAVANAIPAATDTAFKSATLQIYKEYLSKTVEVFLRAIYGLESNPKKYASMVQEYKDAINDRRGLMGPESFIARIMKGLPDGTGAPITVGFWLRRTMDGSAPGLKAGLEKLVKTYTPERLGAIKGQFKNKK
jgi:hypothetical protein